MLTAGFGLLFADANAKDEVVDFIVDRLPLQDDASDDLRGALDAVAGSAGAVGLVGLIGLAYSASALMGAVRNSLNAIWDFDVGRPPLRGKALDIALVGGLGLLLALSIGIALAQSLAADLGREIGVPGWALQAAFDLVAFALPLALAALVFGVLLSRVPARHQPLRDIWPGIVVATLGYKLVQVGFGIYLDNFADYSAVYGSLGAIIAFMAFVYIAAMAFMMGAEYARLWPAVRAGEADSEGGDGEPFGRRLLGFLKGLAVNPDRRRPTPRPRERDGASG